MGSDRTLEKALYKAGGFLSHLPNFGNIVLHYYKTICQGRSLTGSAFYGYGIWATKGTASYFENHGLRRLVEKIGSDDNKDIPAYIRRGKIQANINTVEPSGQQISMVKLSVAQLSSTSSITALDTADAGWCPSRSFTRGDIELEFVF